MNIDPTQNTPRIVNTETRDIKKTDEAKAGAQAPAAAASARFQASGISDASQDIDMARVNEIRDAISQGKLEIRSDKIADGLIASAQALVSGKS
ncbi:Anti-sigma-28 factor [Salinisphaera sp. C84B14]|uniref:flagellar biosynthesis anti-sigma factor FlgM n=1 Tax=Salinisphaera sp. C84B14 TaxID=1304155 RepID=UPI0032B2A282